ncbi:hypothetical protein V5799_011839 [Amblyomma americanum]|uniref:Uncharacterized protein n=1 Tax=Amblyomma americanum TaxID=6943 RepID=A0AAQ4EG67_AMBAM
MDDNARQVLAIYLQNLTEIQSSRRDVSLIMKIFVLLMVQNAERILETHFGDDSFSDSDDDDIVVLV